MTRTHTSTIHDQLLPIVVLVSGSGTLLQSIIDNQGTNYTVVGVVADGQCPALTRAEAAGIPTECVPLTPGADRVEWNQRLADAVEKRKPQLVVSAGFMKILGPDFLAVFSGRIINTHPALLPSFPGAHAVRDALAYGVKVTGSTVHFVDEGVDTGPIIAQEPVIVLPGESEADLHERIKQVERRLIVTVLNSATLGHGGGEQQGEVNFRL